MYLIYSILYSVGFIVLLPRFIFDAFFNGKYAAGFWQRLGFVHRLTQDSRPVVWFHCVSVGETNAARALIGRMRERFPKARIVVSTTTRTGQKLANEVFADTAELVFYFPFDWTGTVRRTLRRIRPSAVLLLETEIWPNFIRETSHSGARIAMVNGRLSERSFKRYAYLRKFVRRTLGYFDAALMQDKADATRLMALGLRASKVKVTGNLKFDHDLSSHEDAVSADLHARFRFTEEAPLVIAASTHSPEETWVLDAFRNVWKSSTAKQLPRLMIAPRHPERFNEVADLIRKSGFAWARRSEPATETDASSEIILLDTIGELRSAYALAEIVFVGGSLIKHGGQSVLEPAAAGKAVVTGPHTTNFSAAVQLFRENEAIIQLTEGPASQMVENLRAELSGLLDDPEKRRDTGRRALAVMDDNRGAVERSLNYLAPLLTGRRP